VYTCLGTMSTVGVATIPGDSNSWCFEMGTVISRSTRWQNSKKTRTSSPRLLWQIAISLLVNTILPPRPRHRYLYHSSATSTLLTSATGMLTSPAFCARRMTVDSTAKTWPCPSSRIPIIGGSLLHSSLHKPTRNHQREHSWGEARVQFRIQFGIWIIMGLTFTLRAPVEMQLFADLGRF
jgi:hypothetical protein